MEYVEQSLVYFGGYGTRSMETDRDDGRSGNLQQALDVQAKGDRVLCDICDAELLMLTDNQTAAQQQLSPGIDCPVSEQHIWQRFMMSNKIFDEFKRSFTRHDREFY